ncbi:MAG: hypothetical protein Q7T20_13350 [Saprospiraceae bacterium]|nr:hypothetical protein [Saprospiraceae bacterium]
MQLTELISAIQTTHEYTQRFAVQQTNVALAIRYWVFDIRCSVFDIRCSF